MITTPQTTFSFRGFTLIELLVVIAIIGMLSAVVLGSLNTARNKGADAAIKGNLSGARSQAELFYDSNTYSYAGVCAGTGTNVIGPLVLAGAKASGLATYLNNTGGGTISNAVCNDVAQVGSTPSAWSAQVRLKQGGVFCIDSTGLAVSSTVSLITSAADYSCL